MGTFDPERLMRVNRQKLVDIRDRAVQLRFETDDHRCKQLGLKVIEAAELVVGRGHQAEERDAGAWLSDLDGTAQRVANARDASLKIRHDLKVLEANRPVSEKARTTLVRLGEIHRDLEACLRAVDGDFRRLLVPA